MYETATDLDKGDGVGVPEPRFVKVHDAYSTTLKGEPLLGGSKAAKGAIVLLRDPLGFYQFTRPLAAVTH